MKLGGGYSRGSRLALGICFRYWKCLKAYVVEFFIGPFKLWLYLSIPGDKLMTFRDALKKTGGKMGVFERVTIYEKEDKP